jgi:tRNA threonylcarbamoyladenosine biosynthesis protein TsaE
MEIVFTLQQIETAATAIAVLTKEHKIFTLSGEMGAGKTTLVAAICKALGYTGKTSSPTFSLINEYILPTGNAICHVDLYRIKNLQEAIDAGIEDIVYSDNICFIEWPSITPTLIPTEAVGLTLVKIDDNSRQLTINL